MIRIAPARSEAEIASIRSLFAEYIGGLKFDVSFQNHEAELAALPGRYAPPGGELLLAHDQDGEPVGGVAMRPLPEAGSCEIKRLYVRPQARGHDLGRRLAHAILACAREAGYAQARLDTHATMTAALHLYGSLGFRETPPYYEGNPLDDVVYMALDLRPM